MPPADMTAPEDPQTFPELLKWHRAQRGWTQSDLARAGRIMPNTLSRIELGQRNPMRTTVLLLAEGMHATKRETNELLMAAGHAPTEDEPRLTDDPTIRTLVRVLDSTQLPARSKANLRACIEVMCATWLATVPGRVAERREI